MDITGFSDIGFPLFGSCDVESADFCLGLEDQTNFCTPSTWLSAGVVCVTPCDPWALWISCRLCLQGKLPQLCKGHISSSCEACGKGFNFLAKLLLLPFPQP